MKISLYKSASTKTANGDVTTHREWLPVELEIEQLIIMLVHSVSFPYSLPAPPVQECNEVIRG